jgi:hypothetical protein
MHGHMDVKIMSTNEPTFTKLNLTRQIFVKTFSKKFYKESYTQFSCQY